MTPLTTRLAPALVALALTACSAGLSQENRPVTPRAVSPADSDNPLLRPWSGPYGGVPAFDEVRVAHFAPAFERAMAEARRELGRITARTDPPTFANTIEAFEDGGRTLARVRAAYGVWKSTQSGPEFQALDRELAPKLAAFEDEIIQNEALFERIAAVYRARGAAGLTPEQERLVWRKYTDFTLAGAQLDAASKRELARINQRLAVLYTTFAQNVLGDEEEHALVLDSEADLAGLPQAVRAGAAAAAEAHGLPGKWLIANTRSAVEPFLTFAARRELRERVFRTFVSRGEHPGARDNRPVIAEILRLRAERARLLGYETHAHWSLTDTMAKTPEATLALMEAVWRPAVARVHEEVAEMQAIADREGAKIAIAPWDYRYYAEKVRKAKYDLDEQALEPYLQLDRLREGMFWVASQLFGLTFERISDVPVYHPDVSVWEVKDAAASRHVGLWYFDPYARPGKQSGAWMSTYRPQERFRGEVTSLVSNNANFVRPSPGQPVLVSWDDALTLFHEFGHALHALASNVTYPSLAGTAVPRDYVEFPSQLFEQWLPTEELLARFALHHATGAPIPEELVAKIERARTFNEGFKTVEYLATALVDMKLHLAGAQVSDAVAFERATLAALGMPEQIVMRHRTPQLSHVFAGDSYAAGYYSYLWSDTLAADAFEAFCEAGGPYDRTVAARLHEHVFSRGNSLDPAAAYRAFRGRDPKIGALMRKRGFPVPAEP